MLWKAATAVWLRWRLPWWWRLPKLEGQHNKSQAKFKLVGDKILEVQTVAAVAIEQLEKLIKKCDSLTTFADSRINAIESVVEDMTRQLNMHFNRGSHAQQG